MELPAKKASREDSLSKAFKAYWAIAEREGGIDILREQMRAHDIDHSKIWHVYLFDSTVVIYPFMPFFWIFRAKPKH